MFLVPSLYFPYRDKSKSLLLKDYLLIGLPWHEKQGHGRGQGKERKEEVTGDKAEDEVIFKKCAATRLAKTRFQPWRADPGRHFDTLG